MLQAARDPWSLDLLVWMNLSSPVPASLASAVVPSKHCDARRNRGDRPVAVAWPEAGVSLAGGEGMNEAVVEPRAGRPSAALSTPQLPLVGEKEMLGVGFPHATRASVAQRLGRPRDACPLTGTSP